MVSCDSGTISGDKMPFSGRPLLSARRVLRCVGTLALAVALVGEGGWREVSVLGSLPLAHPELR